jgi:hypothetical protein
MGSGPGPSWGITFGSSALALTSGNYSSNPTVPTIVFFLTGPGVVMNVPAGFTEGFSFYYASGENTGTVTVYDGVDATGTVLATINLPATGSNCGGSPDTYSCWVPIGGSFSGTARSVNFSGGANNIGFDNITIGSSTPEGVPVPPTLLLVLAGIGGASAWSVRKRFSRS